MKISTALRKAREESGMYRQGSQWVTWQIERDCYGRVTEYVDSPRSYWQARNALAEKRQRRAEAMLAKTEPTRGLDTLAETV